MQNILFDFKQPVKIRGGLKKVVRILCSVLYIWMPKTHLNVLIRMDKEDKTEYLEFDYYDTRYEVPVSDVPFDDEIRMNNDVMQ
jgi:hypothetical protein